MLSCSLLCSPASYDVLPNEFLLRHSAAAGQTFSGIEAANQPPARTIILPQGSYTFVAAAMEA
jgi:hypothetical protein